MSPFRCGGLLSCLGLIGTLYGLVYGPCSNLSHELTFICTVDAPEYRNDEITLLYTHALHPTLQAQRTARYSYDVALLGEMPYGAAKEPAYQRLIDDVNSLGPQSVAHIGDTKSGSTLCDDAHYSKTLGFFNNFYALVIYSVGDNEWSDCMRTNNGKFDPVGRLSLVRKTYFANNLSLGRRSTELVRQSSAYPENAMWFRDPAVFLSVHTAGSNNNREYKMGARRRQSVLRQRPGIHRP